mmetsp:Transcript_37086/g.106157  ORF Transcript_37086/g.106157 Transcript_37086/m.106157 type:complete len:95 (-) Transcript_37086:1069-1353(-)
MHSCTQQAGRQAGRQTMHAVPLHLSNAPSPLRDLFAYAQADDNHSQRSLAHPTPFSRTSSITSAGHHTPAHDKHMHTSEAARQEQVSNKQISHT